MKTALKKNNNDLDMTALWLKNISLLHDLLTHHAPKQSCVHEGMPLLTFDVSSLTHALSELRIQAYQQLVSITEKRLHNFIVAALLEGEDIPAGSRRRAGPEAGATRAGDVDAPSVARVLRELGSLYAAMSHQALHAALMECAFHQLVYFMSTSALNSLLLRKDVCCCSRGIHIRLNVTQLEEWLRSRGLQTESAASSLAPLIQAAQVLQVSKNTDADAHALVRACTALSGPQIVKILKNYTPHGDVEERVSLDFIHLVQDLLKDRVDTQPHKLCLEVKRVFPVTFPNEAPPTIRADNLAIPDSLKINFLRRV